MTNRSSRVIRPRVQTPSPAGGGPLASTRLPDEILAEHVRRVAICAGVGTGLWLYGLVMDTLVRPYAMRAAVPRTHVPLEIAAIAISALTFAYVRLASHRPETKTVVALVYVVLNAVAIAVLNASSPLARADAMYLSWNTVAILVASMILPATPRQMLAAALIAASMDPLGMWLARLNGWSSASAVQTVVMFMPNYACALVAVLPAHVLHRLGRRLRHAQDMGSYHLVELLGRGGMGEVWRATHRLLKRDAAIKLVRPELLGASSDADALAMLRRFEREAQATATLSSPHTIRIFDFGVTANRTFYYVMELLTGRDLESLVREFGPLPAERVLYLLEQVCRSLADAHACGLVHRDVTPANIYLCRVGLEYDFVKVLDFGLVKFSDARAMQQTIMTGAHTTTGTPAFMAPELILAEGEVDERADVYALGCVAYYLLTGQLVFEADSPMKMFLQHLQATPLPPSARTELPIPRDLDATVLACLEKDPARRPQNASELLRRLRAVRRSTAWDDDTARRWWSTHLPELTLPAAVAPASDLIPAAALY